MPIVDKPPIYRRVCLSLFLNRSKLIPGRLPILLAALSASLCLACHGQPLVIVVAGDGRAEYPWKLPNRPCDSGGINECVTTAIAKAVTTENASILLWTGDIVNVNNRDERTLEDGLTKWRDIMKRYAKNVKIWPVRGNHEVYCYPDKANYDGELISNSAEVWKKIFPELPHNDPKSDDGLSFYSVEGAALIVGLDEYGGANVEPLRRKHSVNQKWLDQVLSENQTAFKFVYGHEAAFMAGRHADDDTLAADASDRNLFWNSLVKAKALYFCGHDHFYDRMSVVRFSSQSGPKGFQITAGTAGAPFYQGVQYSDSALWTLERVAHFDGVYGYILITVDGDKATITFKGALPTAFSQTGTVTFAPMDQIVCDLEGCRTMFCKGS